MSCFGAWSAAGSGKVQFELFWYRMDTGLLFEAGVGRSAVYHGTVPYLYTLLEQWVLRILGAAQLLQRMQPVPQLRPEPMGRLQKLIHPTWHPGLPQMLKTTVHITRVSDNISPHQLSFFCAETLGEFSKDLR